MNQKHRIRVVAPTGRGRGVLAVERANVHISDLGEGGHDGKMAVRGGIVEGGVAEIVLSTRAYHGKGVKGARECGGGGRSKAVVLMCGGG